MTTDSLIKSVSIEAMLQARDDAVEERLAFIYPLVKEIDGIAQHTPGISGFKTIAESAVATRAGNGPYGRTRTRCRPCCVSLTAPGNTS